MKGKIRLFGRYLPAWIVAAAIIVGTAGAATGVVLSGRVTGALTTTASQALLIDTTGSTLTGVTQGLFTREDSGVKFSAGAEVYTGDAYHVKLALANRSAVELTGQLTLIAPDGVTLSVAPVNPGAIVDQNGDTIPDALVQTGPFTWQFRMNPEALGTGGPDVDITVATADDLPPGFYSIDGTLTQVAQ